jgi:hypothetical protein
MIKIRDREMRQSGRHLTANISVEQSQDVCACEKGHPDYLWAAMMSVSREHL